MIASPSSVRAPAFKGRLELPALVVLAATSFNAVLAVINAHFMRLSPTIVILAEIVLLAAAHILALLRYRSEMAPWYLLLGLLFLVFLGRSLATGYVEPKFIRDVTIIPTFIILGIGSNSAQLERIVLLILGFVALFGVMEAIFPDTYANVFNIKSYYEQTRGYQAEDFFNKQSSLFVSATRPEARTFAFIDLPRLSSIFLEPVSLGNYCIIMVAYLCTRSRHLSTGVLCASMLAVAFLTIGCDGRLASVSAILVVGVCLAAPYLPPFSAALYLPFILISASVVVPYFHPDAGADDFTGRVAYTLDMLGQFTLQDLLGYSDRFLQGAVDSGVAYLIITQSLIGAALIWLFIACVSTQRSLEQIRFTHSVLLYMALAMTVSYSMLTIKTAALTWFIHGVIQQQGSKQKSAAEGRREA